MRVRIETPDGTRKEADLLWSRTHGNNKSGVVVVLLDNQAPSTDFDMSKALEKNAPLYKDARKMFLLMCMRIDGVCPITGRSISLESDIHHKKGRSATAYADQWAKDREIPLLIDVRHFLAVSREGHDWIESHPAEARELGYSLSRLDTIR